MPKAIHTPVAFIIFNRPEQTRRVFDQIKKARPAKLFIIADGPRTEAEREKCKEARAVVDDVDWKCEVYKKYEEELGVKYAPPTGISWVFEHVNQAIILEDDCVPDQSFFLYCQELLERYKDDERVMSISGNNFQQKNIIDCPESYYFSVLPHIWGWATWRRAWRHLRYQHTTLARG